MLWAIGRFLLLPFVAYERFLVAIARYRVIEGFRVGVLVEEGAEQVWDNVARGLALIRSVDGNQFARMRRGFRRILVYGSSTGAHFYPWSSTCVLDEAMVREDSEVVVASYLVHEAMHAYVDKFWASPRKRLRVEVLCTKAEIAFTSKLRTTDYTKLQEYLDYLRERLREAENLVRR